MTSATDFAPPAQAHRLEIEVRDEHIDALRHVNNVQWVRWVIDVAVAHSAAVGLDIAAYLELGVIWVVRRQEIDYLAPAHVKDSIVASTWVASYGRRSSTRKSLFVRADDGRPLLRAVTTWVMVDLRGRAVDVPAAVAAKLPCHEPAPT